MSRATAPLSRSAPIGKGNGRRRASAAPRAVLSLETCQVVYRRQKGLCICGCGHRIAPFPIGYHHILPKAKWPELIDVAENVVGTAADCHANHETAAKRLTLVHVACVAAVGLDEQQRAYLTRTYR